MNSMLRFKINKLHRSKQIIHRDNIIININIYYIGRIQTSFSGFKKKQTKQQFGHSFMQVALRETISNQNGITDKFRGSFQ